ncbi:acyl-CoA N-acyltransferase [Chiua virens]|nr:acyl-CoA N-acyltransferase [Chiua virens]
MTIPTGFRCLRLPLAQLSLSAVLKCGQSFRWTSYPIASVDDSSEPSVYEYRFCLRDRVVCLRQSAEALFYRSVFPDGPLDPAQVDVREDETLVWLQDYFQLDIDLVRLYDEWSERDPVFRNVRSRFPGIRMLRQDPWENLVSFICSSNNNIARITKMVHALCKHYSPPLLTLDAPIPDSDCVVKDVDYHPFPPPSALAPPEVATKLRALGFGYRADFIQRTAKMLVEKHGTTAMDSKAVIEVPEKWLMTLRDLNTSKAREELLNFVGVGRKVADCILLMSLDKKEVIPVDTHVHQIAAKYYGFRSLGSSKKVNMTPKLYDEINSKLADNWGEYAGWAHSVLFTSDLKKFSSYGMPASPSGSTEITPTSTPRATPSQSASKKRTRTELLDTDKLPVIMDSASQRNASNLIEDTSLAERVKRRRGEIIDTTQDTDHENNSSGSEAEHTGRMDNSQDAPQASSSKRKRKKKSKAAKILDSLRGNEIPQSIVDHVVSESKAAEQGSGMRLADAEAVRQALDHLKLMDAIKGKMSITGRSKNALGEHKVWSYPSSLFHAIMGSKFWATQPVPQLGDQPPAEDGYIEPTKVINEVRQEPYPLPKDFEWSILELNDPKQIKEVYDLLSLNYVEDDEAAFRFKYSAEFLEWALKPPGYRKEWHIGVRVSSNKKLVAFISGVPITLRVRQNVFLASEINYLCIHKKLRSKRLTPVLIKEVTRQVNLCGIAQAIYTVGLLLPTPVATCRYFHRLINVPKLIDIKFAYVPRNMTLARMIRIYKVESKITLPGLREIEEKDIPEVADLFARYMQRFDMVPLMTIDEVRHQFLSGKGDLDQPFETHRRPKQVVWTYVVEDPETHRMTDFFSFYSLPSTVINSPKYDVVEACYLFYYASDVAFADGEDMEVKLKKRLTQLIGDALIIANQAKFDVFNAVSLMDNMNFLEDLKFGAGDGLLNFYLYNWRTPTLAGITPTGGADAGRGVGVVML